MIKCVIELNDSPEVVVNDVFELGLKELDLIKVNGVKCEVRSIRVDREFNSNSVTSIRTYKAYDSGVTQDPEE